MNFMVFLHDSREGRDVLAAEVSADTAEKAVSIAESQYGTAWDDQYWEATPYLKLQMANMYSGSVYDTIRFFGSHDEAVKKAATLPVLDSGWEWVVTD